MSKGLDNSLTLAGTVRRGPDTRRSPAGIPITRFTLQHHSRREVAGIEREVSCAIQVVASGEAIQPWVRQLAAGSVVQVTGVLARASHQPGEQRLVLHAETIESLPGVQADSAGTGNNDTLEA